VAVSRRGTRGAKPALPALAAILDQPAEDRCGDRTAERRHGTVGRRSIERPVRRGNLEGVGA